MDSVPLLHVEYLIKSGLTYDEVSENLQRSYPGVRGLLLIVLGDIVKSTIFPIWVTMKSSLAVEAITEVFLYPILYYLW